MSEQILRIGCHLSSSKGFLNMAKTAKSIGANTFQFFTRNPRGGATKDWQEADILAMLAFFEEEGIAKPLAHAPYVLNCCLCDSCYLQPKGFSNTESIRTPCVCLCLGEGERYSHWIFGRKMPMKTKIFPTVALIMCCVLTVCMY